MSLGRRPGPVGLYNRRRGASSILSDGAFGGFSMREPLGLAAPGGGHRVTRLAQATPARAISPSAQANAQIDAFASGAGAGAFKKISRAAVAAGLRQRVQDPNGIKQGSSSLCGPSALVRTVAYTDPVAYVTFVVALYETGRGQVGDLKVAAGGDLLNYDPGSQVEPVDWIPIASLRDSENWFFDYQAAENAFAGITLPSHMESWFHKIGFREIINDTNVVLTKGDENLRRANDLFAKDYWVCLFVNANMLDPEKMRGMSATPDHWVVLTAPVVYAATGVSFAVFSWGEGHYPIPYDGSALAVSDLLKNYYGFVAARR